ncbi:CASP-like protein 4B2 isoform X2 [Zingiber officinale]|uniref:CASP-like protein 4B2 isoform X2 n=1 Tax=Zingiber officinale TaxID=94328 RepID=UPI001C4AFF88|nr:CASP-like protein 4B2 isoform X2 [Zingiber officinale]
MTTTDTSELGPRGVANETPPSDSGSPFPTFPTFPTTPLSATPPGAPRPRPVRRTSRMEDLLDKVVLLLRAFAGLFSLVALIVLASNKHGDWEDFSRYQEYRYLLAVSVLAFAYSMAQIIRQRSQTRGGLDLVPIQYSWIVDFSGDQVIAYLLISASSAAIPITNHMRETVTNIFTDASAASISMAFLAFIALAVSSLISGYRVSKNYI